VLSVFLACNDPYEVADLMTGVTVYVNLPESADIEAIHARHTAGGVVTTALASGHGGSGPSTP
jgi:hypothetical protein